MYCAPTSPDNPILWVIDSPQGFLSADQEDFQSFTLDLPAGYVVQEIEIAMKGTAGGDLSFFLLDARIVGAAVDNPTTEYTVRNIVIGRFKVVWRKGATGIHELLHLVCLFPVGGGVQGGQSIQMVKVAIICDQSAGPLIIVAPPMETTVLYTASFPKWKALSRGSNPGE